MFDVGFWELVIIAVVALLVVGPERLPKLARTLGLWLGKGRRLLSSVKADIDRELRAEELKSILDKQARSNPLEEIVEDTRSAARDIEKSAGEVVKKSRETFESSATDAAKQSDDGK